MVRKNKHLPEEMYREIISYLLPKHLLATKEVKNYNKVVADIPGFEAAPPPQRVISSATNKFRIVRFIYRLKKKLQLYSNRNIIIVFLPYEEETLYTLAEQYNIYHLLQNNQEQRNKKNKTFIERAKYGW